MSKTKVDSKQVAASAATKVKKKTQADSMVSKKARTNKESLKLKISTMKISKKKARNKPVASKVKKTKETEISEKKIKYGSSEGPVKLKFSKGKLKMLKQTKESLKKSSYVKKDEIKKTAKCSPVKLKCTNTLNNAAVNKVQESMYTKDIDLDSEGGLNNCTDDVYIVDTDYEASDDDWEPEMEVTGDIFDICKTEEPETSTNTAVVQTQAVTCVELISSSQNRSNNYQKVSHSQKSNLEFDLKLNTLNFVTNKSHELNKKLSSNKVDKYKVRNHLNRNSKSLVNLKAEPPTHDSNTPVVVVEERLVCEICKEEFLSEEHYKFHLHKHFDSFEEYTNFINKRHKGLESETKNYDDNDNCVEDHENLDNSQTIQENIFDKESNQPEVGDQQIVLIGPMTKELFTGEGTEKKSSNPPKETSYDNSPSSKQVKSFAIKKSLKVILRRTKVTKEASKSFKVGQIQNPEQSKDEGIDMDLSCETIQTEKEVQQIPVANKSFVRKVGFCKGEQERADKKRKNLMTKDSNAHDISDDIENNNNELSDQSNISVYKRIDSGTKVNQRETISDTERGAQRKRVKLKRKTVNKKIQSNDEKSVTQIDNNLLQAEVNGNRDMILFEQNSDLSVLDKDEAFRLDLKGNDNNSSADLGKSPDSTEVIVEKGDYKIKIKCGKTNLDMETDNCDVDKIKSKQMISETVENAYQDSNSFRSTLNDVTCIKNSKRKKSTNSNQQKAKKKLKENVSKVHVLYEQSNEEVNFRPKPKVVSVSPERLHQLRQQLQMTREARARGKGKVTEKNGSLITNKTKSSIQKRLEDVFRDRPNGEKSYEKDDKDFGDDLVESMTARGSVEHGLSSNIISLTIGTSNTKNLMIGSGSTEKISQVSQTTNNDVVTNQTSTADTRSKRIEKNNTDSDRVIMELMDLAEGRTPEGKGCVNETRSKHLFNSHESGNNALETSFYNSDINDESSRSQEPDDIISEIMDLCVGNSSVDKNPVHSRGTSKTINFEESDHSYDNQVSEKFHEPSVPLELLQKSKASLKLDSSGRTGRGKGKKKQTKGNKLFAQRGSVNSIMTESYNASQGSTGAYEIIEDQSNSYSRTVDSKYGHLNSSYDELNKENLESYGFKVISMNNNEKSEPHSHLMEFTATPLYCNFDKNSQNILKCHGFRIPSVFRETVTDDCDELKNQPSVTVRSDVCEAYLLDCNTNQDNFSNNADDINTAETNETIISDALSSLLKHEKKAENVNTGFHQRIYKEQKVTEKNIDEPDSGKCFQTSQDSCLTSHRSSIQKNIHTCSPGMDKKRIDYNQFSDSAVSDNVLALPLNYPVAELFKKKIREEVTEEENNSKSMNKSSENDISNQSGQMLRCSMCGKWFKENTELDQHIISEHTEKNKKIKSREQLNDHTEIGEPAITCRTLPSQKVMDFSDMNKTLQIDKSVNVSLEVHSPDKYSSVNKHSKMNRKHIIPNCTLQSNDLCNPSSMTKQPEEESVYICQMSAPQGSIKIPGLGECSVTKDYSCSQMLAAQDTTQIPGVSLYRETVQTTGVSEKKTPQHASAMSSHDLDVSEIIQKGHLYKKVEIIPENNSANDMKTQDIPDNVFDQSQFVVNQGTSISHLLNETKFSEIRKILSSPNKTVSQNYESMNCNKAVNTEYVNQMNMKPLSEITVESSCQKPAVNNAIFCQNGTKQACNMDIDYKNMNQVVTKNGCLERVDVTDTSSIEDANECYLNEAMKCPVCYSEMSRKTFLNHKIVCFVNHHVDESKTVGNESVVIEHSTSELPSEHDTSGVSQRSIPSESDTYSDTSQMSGSDLKVVLTKVKNCNLIINGTSLNFCGSAENPLWKVKARKRHKIREKSNLLSKMETVFEESVAESPYNMNMSCKSILDKIEMNDRFVTDRTSKRDWTTENVENQDEVHMASQQSNLQDKALETTTEVLDMTGKMKSSEESQISELVISSSIKKTQCHDLKQHLVSDTISDKRKKGKTKKKVGLKKSPLNSRESNITDFERDLLLAGKSKIKEKEKPRKRHKSDKSNKETTPKKSLSKRELNCTESNIRSETLNNLKVTENHPQKHFMMSKTAQNIVKRDQEKRNQGTDDLPGFPKTKVNLEDLPQLTVGDTFDEINNNIELLKTGKDESNFSDVLRSAGAEKELSKQLKKSLESLGIVKKTTSSWTDSIDNPLHNLIGKPSHKRTYDNVDTNPTLSSYEIPKFDFNSSTSRSQGPFTAFSNNSSWVSSFSNIERQSFSFSSIESSSTDTTIKPGTHISNAQQSNEVNQNQITSVANSYGGLGFYRENYSLSFTNTSDQWESFIQSQKQKRSSHSLSGLTQVRESPTSSTPIINHKKLDQEKCKTDLEISQISSIHGKTETPTKRIRLKRYPTDEIDSRIVVRANTNSPRKVQMIETQTRQNDKNSPAKKSRLYADDKQRTIHSMFGKGDFLMDEQSTGKDCVKGQTEEVQDWHLLDEVVHDKDTGNYTDHINLGFERSKQNENSDWTDDQNHSVANSVGNFVEQSEELDYTYKEKVSGNEISDRISDVSDIEYDSDKESEIGETITDNEDNSITDDRETPDVESQENKNQDSEESEQIFDQEFEIDLDQEREKDLQQESEKNHNQESEKNLDIYQQRKNNLDRETKKDCNLETEIEKDNHSEKEQSNSEEFCSDNEKSSIESDLDNDGMARSNSKTCDDENSEDKASSFATNEDTVEEKDGINDADGMEDVLYLSDPDMDMFMNEISDEEEQRSPKSKEISPDINTVIKGEQDLGRSPQVFSRQSSNNDDILKKEAENNMTTAGSRRPRWMPYGYCFNFFNKRQCSKKPCNFTHTPPPPGNIIARSFREHLDRNDNEICLDILRSHPGVQEIPKQQIDILYRRVNDNVECYWLLKFMKDREMPLQMVLDNYVRAFAWSGRLDYVFGVFEMAKELNIQLQNDVVCHLLEVFSTQDIFLEKLITIMVYSTEDENFVVPQKFVKIAFNMLPRVPQLASQLLAWLVGNTQQLQHLIQDKDLVSKLSDQLKKMNVCKDLIEKVETILKVLSANPGSSQDGKATGTEQGQEEFVGWTSEDEQFWRDNVKSVKFSKDFTHLARLFDEKRRKSLPFTDGECELYINVIYHDKSSVNWALDQFIKGVKDLLPSKKGLEEEINKQVLSIIFGAFDKCYTDLDYVMCLAILDTMSSHGVFPSQIHSFLMKSVDVCVQTNHTKFALEILKGVELDEMDLRIQFNFIHLLDTLAKQLGNQNILFECLRVVQMAIKLVYNGQPNLKEREKQIDLPLITSCLINEFLKQNALNYAITVFELVQHCGQRFPFNKQIHFQLMLYLCETDHKYVAEAAFKKLCQRKEFPPQTYSRPRSINIPCILNPITAEVILIVEDYLMTLYNELCQMVMSSQPLDTTQLYLKVFVPQNQSMPQSAAKMLREIKITLETKLRPPLLAEMSYGCLTINANSLENYLKDLDKKGRCQGLKFVPRNNPRPAHRGRGRGFLHNRIQ